MKKMMICVNICEVIKMENIDLLKGRILPTLTKLTIPIVLTAMIQMAYNMTDMLWIGKLGANSVAAIGVAGMFTWLSNGLVMMPRIGGQVKTGHSIGENNVENTIIYESASFQIAIVFALLFALLMFIMAPTLVGLFQLNNSYTINSAIGYMQICCGLCLFNFLNQIITGVFFATGDSKTPFIANSVGLAVNIILDPVFIFGIGFIPAMNVLGAAAATVLAQMIVTVVFILIIIKNNNIIKKIRLNKVYHFDYYLNILKIGFPMALQNMLFSICSMVIARFVAGYGDGAVAAQKIGTQIESISWGMGDGFQAAINSFIAQNYGAQKIARVKKGYRTMMVISVVWGAICMILLIFQPDHIFQLFLNDAQVLPIGVSYLTIIGFSQIFMICEITTAGAFSGLGNSFPPSFVSIVFTVARIPFIFILTNYLGLDGIWWAISFSSILKGIVSFIWFEIYKKKQLIE